MDVLNPEILLTEELNESSPDKHDDRARKRITAIVFFAFFVVLLSLVHFLNNALTRGNPEIGHFRFRVVEIPPGSSVSDIAGRLAEKKIISSELLFKATAAMRGTARELKAGEYRFDRSMSLMEVLSWLEDGRVMLHRFTVPEGLTVAQIATLLSSKGLTNAQEFTKIANDPDFCDELGVGGPNLEGFLFPDTYKIAKGLSARAIIHIMVDKFWSKTTGEMPVAVSDDEGNLRNIVTIASIIEKEAMQDDEKPLIAGVIYNRMRLKMPLQCDVTIRYPLDNYGVELTAEDLRLKSPFNSYLHRGLPPTPICNPGFAAIKAALKPTKTKYLYFVSMNNGHHKFSTTLAEHHEAVFKYRVLNEHG